MEDSSFARRPASMRSAPCSSMWRCSSPRRTSVCVAGALAGCAAASAGAKGCGATVSTWAGCGGGGAGKFTGGGCWSSTTRSRRRSFTTASPSSARSSVLGLVFSMRATAARARASASSSWPPSCWFIVAQGSAGASRRRRTAQINSAAVAKKMRIAMPGARGARGQSSLPRFSARGENSSRECQLEAAEPQA